MNIDNGPLLTTLQQEIKGVIIRIQLLLKVDQLCPGLKFSKSAQPAAADETKTDVEKETKVRKKMKLKVEELWQFNLQLINSSKQL